MVSLFSCGDKFVLAILEDRWEESCESVLRRMRYADSNEVSLPNSFSEGGEARRWPESRTLEKSPRREQGQPAHAR